MILNCREQGDGQAVVILHGLFGSADNWNAVAGVLSARRRVVSIDLTNHGDSPHAEHFSYESIARDVSDTVSSLAIDRCDLIGHSMGGKVAMALALEQPEAVRSLVVVDIAPTRYPASHGEIFDAYAAVEKTQPKTRRDADAVLAKFVGDTQIRAFLLKNFVKGPRGYALRLNHRALADGYDTILGWPDLNAEYGGPTLFVRGERSTYVPDDVVPAILGFFPRATVETIESAGHWIHAEAFDEFLSVVSGFLNTEHSA